MEFTFDLHFVVLGFLGVLELIAKRLCTHNSKEVIQLHCKYCGARMTRDDITDDDMYMCPQCGVEQ
jgi:predicted RNA-binding Zn-ribbon protein involved in translation (DUF1610 family)